MKITVRNLCAEAVNEASALISRGGEPTKLFQVIDYIMEGGNDATILDLQPIFPHVSTLYVTLKNTPGILTYTDGRTAHYCITRELYDQYKRASREIGWEANPWVENKAAKAAKAPAPSTHRAKPAPAPAPTYEPGSWDDYKANGEDPAYQAYLREVKRYADPYLASKFDDVVFKHWRLGTPAQQMRGILHDAYVGDLSDDDRREYGYAPKKTAPKPAPAPAPKPAPKPTAPVSSEPVSMTLLRLKGWYYSERAYERDTSTIGYCNRTIEELKKRYLPIASAISLRTDSDSDDAIIASYYLTVPTAEADKVRAGLEGCANNFDEYVGVTSSPAADAVPAAVHQMTEGEKLYLLHKNESSQTVKFYGIEVYGSKHERTYDRWSKQYELKPTVIAVINRSDLPDSIVKSLVSYKLTFNDSYYKGLPINVVSSIPRDADGIITNGFVDYLSYHCGYNKSYVPEVTDQIQLIATKYPSAMAIGQGGAWDYSDGGKFRPYSIPDSCKADYVRMTLKAYDVEPKVR